MQLHIQLLLVSQSSGRSYEVANMCLRMCAPACDACANRLGSGSVVGCVDLRNI